MTPIRPLKLILDLDEMLISVKLKKHTDSLSKLSTSAQSALSPSDSSNVENHDKGYKITAINRQRWMPIFDKIYSIKQHCKKYDIKCPIDVCIMTAATYQEKDIKEVFNKFYGDGTKRFTNGDFPIDYYNRLNLPNYGKDVYKMHEDVETNGHQLDPRKAYLMEELYHTKWVKEMPDLVKKRIYLVDNADCNAEAAKIYGFNKIHYATTPTERITAKNFTKEGPRALEKLMRLVTELEQSILGTGDAYKNQSDPNLIFYDYDDSDEVSDNHSYEDSKKDPDLREKPISNTIPLIEKNLNFSDDLMSVNSLLNKDDRLSAFSLMAYHYLPQKDANDTLKSGVSIPNEQERLEFMKKLFSDVIIDENDRLILNESILTKMEETADEMLDSLENGTSLPQVLDTISKHPNKHFRCFVLYRVAHQLFPGKNIYKQIAYFNSFDSDVLRLAYLTSFFQQW